MKYFLDTEFLEGTQTDFRKFKIMRAVGIMFLVSSVFMFIKGSALSVTAGIIDLVIGTAILFLSKYEKTPNTIDLVSVGIVCEDGREFYEVSKDFNLKEAWNRYDLKINKHYPVGPKYLKEYWIRDNVLLPIFKDWVREINRLGYIVGEPEKHIRFTYKNFKSLRKRFGKSNKEMAKGIRNFVMAEKYSSGGQVLLGDFYPNESPEPVFYAYYADYDWVGFCWLFGKMMDLPNGFPMYCRDLKQMLDLKWGIDNECVEYLKAIQDTNQAWPSSEDMEDIFKLENIKEHPNYPKQVNEHIALEDARWNKKLYEFLRTV